MTGQAWIHLIETERGQYPRVKVAYTPVPCMHCRAAPCLAQSRDEAVYRRPDGIVIIDPVKAQGQKQLISACPYGVIYWNEEKNIPQKCTFCAHLLDQGWQEPRCVELCPAGALTFGDLDDPASAVSRLLTANKTEALQPEYGLRENVVYMGLPKKFIAGTVAYRDTDEVAEGATVTLTGEGVQKVTQTNGFGDFEFEDLAGDSTYRLIIKSPGYQVDERQVETRTDVYLGVILLTKSPPG
jgi:Fe-S-cluster-containing dehydrogenase component